MHDHPPPIDPVFAPIANADGSINRALVQALFMRSPSTLTLSEIDAMHIIVFGYEKSPRGDTLVAGEGHLDGPVDGRVHEDRRRNGHPRKGETRQRRVAHGQAVPRPG
jgi:hypothetical protein